MKTMLQIAKTKLFLGCFLLGSAVILAATVPQIRNLVMSENIVGEKITSEQKKIATKIKKQNKTITASRVTSGVAFETNNVFEATLTSDAPDYTPFSTAIFTGDGFAPN